MVKSKIGESTMSKEEKAIPAEIEATLTPVVDKTAVTIGLLYEKLSRTYNLSLEEIREATVTIVNGEVTVKVKEPKEQEETAE